MKFKFLRSSVWHITHTHPSQSGLSFSGRNNHSLFPSIRKSCPGHTLKPQKVTMEVGKNCELLNGQAKAWHTGKVFKGYQVPQKAPGPGSSET